jgi:hypothetical protein
VDALEVHRDATVTARARWRALRAGRLMISDPGVAHYRLVDGRIVEIWSTRRNYAFMCGAHVERRAGFAAELLRAWWWKMRAPQIDLTDDVQTEPVAFPLASAMSDAMFAAD